MPKKLNLTKEQKGMLMEDKTTTSIKTDKKNLYQKDKFLEYLNAQGLSKDTMRFHTRNVERYNLETLQLEELEELSLSMQLSIGNTLSKYYTFVGKDNELVKKFIHEVNLKRVPKALTSTLTIKDLTNKMNDYYEHKQYREYIVMYLLLNFQVRNMDLDLKIVDMDYELEQDKNYLQVGKKLVNYVRNQYKTGYLYGSKIHAIIDKKFITACRELLNTNLFSYQNYAVQIKRIVGVTEAEVLKIYLKENNNSATFKEVAENRGTNLEVLLENYADTEK
jgi:hypothetical protein